MHDYRTKETPWTSRNIYKGPYAKRASHIMLFREGRWYRVYVQGIGNVACFWIESKGTRIYCD